MSRPIHRVECPCCGADKLACFPERIWKKLKRSGTGRRMLLCGTCAIVLATQLYMQAHEDPAMVNAIVDGHEILENPTDDGEKELPT